MKFQALAATLLAATALTGGSAIAQATMQPIPNPPEKATSMGHKHMSKHNRHMSKHHTGKKAMNSDMSKSSTDTAPAPAPQ